MKINLKYSELAATPGIAQYAEKKFGSLAKFLHKFEAEGDKFLDISVEKTTRHHSKGQVFRVRARLELPGRLLVADKENEDLYATLDIAKDALKIELEKFKEKHERE